MMDAAPAVPSWSRISDPDEAARLLPAWFAPRMMAGRGLFGCLLATGDIVRISRLTAIHLSAAGTTLLDVLLDPPGPPDGIEPAWQDRRFLGAPAPGATLATLNLAQIAMIVEFAIAEIAETSNDLAQGATIEAIIEHPTAPSDLVATAPA